MDEVQDTLEQLFNCSQQIEDSKPTALQLKQEIADENLLAAWVNLGLTVAGVILVVIGLMTLAATFIAFPPLLGGLILGIMGLSLTAIGLFKFGVEFKFAMDEQAVAEKKMDAHFEAAINEAPAVEPDDKQILAALDLPKPSEDILRFKRHIKEKIKPYKHDSSDKQSFFMITNSHAKTAPIKIEEARSSKTDSYASLYDIIEDSLAEKESLLNH